MAFDSLDPRPLPGTGQTGESRPDVPRRSPRTSVPDRFLDERVGVLQEILDVLKDVPPAVRQLALREIAETAGTSWVRDRHVIADSVET